MDRTRRLIRTMAFLLVAAAVVEEMRKPPEERTWRGHVFGLIPYDFRMPTVERLRDAYWNPSNPNVFTDRVLGVGWGVNVYTVWQRLRALASPMLG